MSMVDDSDMLELANNAFDELESAFEEMDMGNIGETIRKEDNREYKSQAQKRDSDLNYDAVEELGDKIQNEKDNDDDDDDNNSIGFDEEELDNLLK